MISLDVEDIKYGSIRCGIGLMYGGLCKQRNLSSVGAISESRRKLSDSRESEFPPTSLNVTLILKFTIITVNYANAELHEE